MALVAMGLGVLVIANDFTALNVALPCDRAGFRRRRRDRAVGDQRLRASTFGMVIVTGGRLADMFGRRRVFFIRSAIFAARSPSSAAPAQEVGWLIATRVGMGIGGALMWPAILGTWRSPALPASAPGSRAGSSSASPASTAPARSARCWARVSHRRAQLALDLLPQRADPPLRRPAPPPRPARARRRGAPDRLRRHRVALGWPVAPAARARPVR